MGLIAHYPLNDGFEDALSPNTATVIGDYNFEQGFLGGCYQSVGPGNYIEIDRGLPRKEMSINFWIKVTSYDTNWRNIFAKRVDNNDCNICLRFANGGVNTQLFCGNGAFVMAAKSVPNTDVFPLNTWVNITISRRSGGKLKLYSGTNLLINESLPNTLVSDTTTPIHVARNETSVSIQDLRFYDHELTLKEIHNLTLGLAIHLPLVKDSYDPASYDEKVVIGGTIEDRGALFTGSNSYIDLGKGPRVQFEDGGALTLACWVSPNSFNLRSMLLAKNKNKETSPYSFIFGFTDGTMNAFDGSGWVGSGIANAVPINDPLSPELKWTHLSWTVNESTVKYYINGELLSTRGGFDYVNDATHDVSLGGHIWDGDFDGWVRDYRIYKTCLSDGDIYALANTPCSLDRGANVYINQIKEPILVLQNFGGPLHTDHGSNMSDSDLRASAIDEVIEPYIKSGVIKCSKNDKAYQHFLHKDNVIWYKWLTTVDGNGVVVTTSINRSGEIFPDTGCIEFRLPPGVTMNDILTSVDGARLNGQVEMLIDGVSYGKTDVVKKWSTGNYGFANTLDDFGEPNDNVMNGWGARHAISYVNTSGQNAIRCQFRCWSGNEDLVQEVVWGVVAL